MFYRTNYRSLLMCVYSRKFYIEELKRQVPIAFHSLWLLNNNPVPSFNLHGNHMESTKAIMHTNKNRFNRITQLGPKVFKKEQRNTFTHKGEL